MIVQSVSLGDTSAKQSGISATRVIPQSPVHFGSNQKPHSVPRAGFISGLVNHARNFAFPLGLATAPAALTTGCDGTDPTKIEEVIIDNQPAMKEPDGGITDAMKPAEKRILNEASDATKLLNEAGEHVSVNLERLGKKTIIRLSHLG